MDGHDENMDGASLGQNSQPVPPVTPINTNDTAQNNASVLPGAIVSTPNMTAPQIYNAADYIDHPAGLGDIKIRGEKKSKKWLWILLAVMAGVAVVAAVVWAVMAFLVPEELTLKESFNAYANYFLYGTESTDDIEGRYEYGSTYYLATFDLSEEQVGEHFKKSEEKYQEFLGKFNKVIEKQPDLVSNETKKVIGDYYERLEKYSYLFMRPVLGGSALIPAFIQNDFSSTAIMESVRDYYNLYINSPVESIRTLGEELVNKTQSFMRILSVYRRNNCLTKSSIAEVCLINTEDTSLVRANQVLSDFNDFVQESNIASNKLSVFLFRNVWIIGREL